MPERAAWRGEWPSPRVLRERIREVLGTDLGDEDCQRLLDFLQLLERWAAKFNLISATSRGEIVDRHLLDSLATLDLVDGATRIADLGSGAGFPGVPLAVARPAAQVFLVEPRAHRANFLRQAVRALSLANAQVFEGRGDAFAEQHAVDLVVARAVPLEELVGFANGALAEGGRAIAMVKARAPERAPEGYAITRKREYRLPGGSHHALVELVRR
jgi:16S rRNA (guanine527-N7)-methyltransferase